MLKEAKIDNKILLEAGLRLMRKNGKILTKSSNRSQAMLYTMPNGDTVRVRTCNDHILVTVADEPTEGARLNIEGTDWLLLVMPEVERTPGRVIGYLVPTEEAVQQVRKSHMDWLRSGPRTKGNNRTWTLWFNSYGPEVNGTEKYAGGYEKKWAKYLPQGEVLSTEIMDAPDSRTNTAGAIKTEVEAARQRIANVAGVSPQAIKISIHFAA